MTAIELKASLLNSIQDIDDVGIIEKIMQYVNALRPARATKKETSTKVGPNYRISPRRKKLMRSVRINPEDFSGDERAQYILSR